MVRSPENYISQEPATEDEVSREQINSDEILSMSPKKLVDFLNNLKGEVELKSFFK